MKKQAAGGLAALLSTSALLLGTVAITPASAQSTSGRTLIIDHSFTLVTADPGHMYEEDGNLIVNAMYDTLVTYSAGSLKVIVPQLATSYDTLNGGRKFVYHLNPAAKFSDGSPVTSADVAWSLTRMINLKGNPAFLLAGETITADGPETVVMTSSTPNPALPYILADPSCGILNMKVVEAHGGTDAADASTKDTAENWLNDNSAGSGPYIMKSFSTTSQVVLVANPNYWGPPPAYSTVVLRNTSTEAIERLDVERGTNEMALDLDPSQTAGMTNVQILSGAGPNVMFIFANDNPKISKITSNHDFQEALRYGINYAGLLQLAGAGAVQSPGVIPTVLLGALPASADAKYDLAQAKSWLAKSGVGHPSLKLTYPTGHDRQRSLLRRRRCPSGAVPRPDRDQRDPPAPIYPGRPGVLSRWHRGARALVLGPGLRGPAGLPGVRSGPPGRAARRVDGDGLCGERPAVVALANKAAATTGVSARQAVYRAVPERDEQVRAVHPPHSARRGHRRDQEHQGPPGERRLVRQHTQPPLSTGASWR